jgi:hypothetical protein
MPAPRCPMTPTNPPAHQQRVESLGQIHCPDCRANRVIGEQGWRLCMECGWDELPPRTALLSNKDE